MSAAHEASAVDAPIPRQYRILHHWRRATEKL
jgi:hypothetical protein